MYDYSVTLVTLSMPMDRYIQARGHRKSLCLSAFASLLVLMLGGNGSCQEPTSRLTLEQALQQALKTHPALARTHFQTGAARERVREAAAGMMPNLAIQSTATNGVQGAPAFGLQGLAGDPLKKHYATGLNVVQPLYDF